MPALLSLNNWQTKLPSYSDRVHLNSLSTTAVLPHDAFGRSQKAQPILITLALSLHNPITSAALTDTVDVSTVHYGKLSKSILSAVSARTSDPLTTHELMRLIEAAALATVPCPEAIQALEMTVALPKASLLGQGVEVTYRKAEWGSARTLRVRDLQIATIIGVNEHEKRAPQMVIVNIWIDALTSNAAADCATEVEQVVVKTITETTFETLESLTTEVASRLIKHVIFRICPGADVRVRADKPTAVMFAAAPGVEITRRSNVQHAFGGRLWEECGRKAPPAIPLPLDGRLDEYLSAAHAHRK